MSFESAIIFFISLFIFAIIPGPGTCAILARALTSGATACFPLALGATISNIIYMIISTLGLGTIAENWSGLFTFIRLIGAAYLLYLSWKIWTAEINTNLEYNNKASTGSWLSGFTQGFLLAASSPKVILFFIAFLPTLIDLSVLNQLDIILTSILTLFALISGFMLVAYSAASARKKIQSEYGIRYLNRIASVLIMGASLFLVFPLFPHLT